MFYPTKTVEREEPEKHQHPAAVVIHLHRQYQV
jgi:hypothetical protein